LGFIFLNLAMLQRFSMSQTFSKFLDGHTFYLRLFDYTTFMAVFIEKVFLVYSFLVL
jgi:hypothetical protein